MERIAAILIYPFVCLLLTAYTDRPSLYADVRNWCRWKQIPHTRFSLCRILVSDRAFRNLLYYRVGPLRRLLSWCLPGYDHLQITTPRSKLGGGLIIQHGFATIISAESIGRNCKIYQQVTIGYNHRQKAPVLGDNVEVCCGAKIIGGVHVGNNVLVGANAVVVKDVPDNSIVAGIPAEVIGILDSSGDIFTRIKQ